uniref:Uncharacterized protein n=1 Tax=Rhizophora mucronata TaxID=61149 RepID=A0A2P2J2W3_RHIMU
MPFILMTLSCECFGCKAAEFGRTASARKCTCYFILLFFFFPLLFFAKAAF